MNENFFTELNTENNLIQHFYEIGADNEIVFCEKYYQNPLRYFNQNDHIQPIIISKFPNTMHSLVNIPDDTIIRHCFPNGFYIKYEQNTHPTPNTFFFELDNFPINPNFPKIFFSCYLFYESLEVYRKIILKKKQIILGEDDTNQKQKKEITDEDMNTSEYINYYLPKVILFASVLPFPRELTKILKTLYNKYIVTQNSYEYPLEKVIENLICNVPIPTRGKFSIIYQLFNEKFIFGQSPANKVPNVSIELNLIFTVFKIRDILTIFKCILLEIPILFFSMNKNILCTFVEGFLSLIYPFQYSYQHISILPFHCYSLIESNDCFVFGVNESYSNKFFSENNLEIDNKSIVVIDIDRARIEYLKNKNDKSFNYVINDINCQKDQSDIDVYNNIDLPSHYKKKLSDQIVKYLKKLKEYQIKNEDLENFNNTIRNAFFYFMISIFWDYDKFVKITQKSLFYLDCCLTNSIKSIDINEIFYCKEFMNNHSFVSDFYKIFISTEIFKAFIIKRIYPRTIQDKFDILFFDEKIKEKQNKSILTKNYKTPLLDIIDFSNLLKVPIQKPKGFSDKEINTLFQKDSIYTALDYYQSIEITKNGNINLKYLLFPKLLYDNIFFNQHYTETYKLNQMHQPINLLNEFNKKYSYIFSNKSFTEIYSSNTNNNTLPSYTVHESIEYNFNLFERYSTLNQKQMHNYIDLSWIIMSSLCYSYINTSNEKCFRFAEIITQLSKIEHIHEEVLIFLYYIIAKHGRENDLVLLYEILMKNKNLSQKYILSSLFFSRLSKCYNPSMKNIKVSTMTSRASVLMRDKEDIINESEERIKNEQFDKRIFVCDSEKTNLAFETVIQCKECNELTQLDFLFNINESFYCQNCQREIKPCINVSINNNVYEHFEVYTPYELYNKLKYSFFTNTQFEIDVISFYKNHSRLFWNCVLYFSMNNLSFDFLFPYSKDAKYDIEEINLVDCFENLKVTTDAMISFS